MIATGSPGQAPAREPGALAGSSGLRTLFTQPLLLKMAGVVAALALIDGLLGYALKAEASARFEGGEGLIRFFAIFHTAAGLVAFGLQASLGERVLKSLGLGGAMALLPGAIVLTGLVGAVYARLMTAALAAGSAFALTNSFFRSGFELLYTPIPPQVKRPTKAYVDVGAQRLGDMASGGLILLLLAALPTVPTFAILGLAALGSLGALALVLRLNKGYVSQLADSLRSGALSLSESEAEDSTTARTIHQTHLTIDRAELLARIRELQQQEDGGDVAPGAEAPDSATEGTEVGPVLGSPPPHLREFLDAVGALRSGRPGLARAALDRAGDDVALVPHVVSLLEGYDLLDAVRAFLVRLSPRVVGQLTDALLAPESAVLVRRRLPSVLETCEVPRAMEALLLGMDDRDFEVRLRCARAAARLGARKPDLRPDPPRVFELAERELRVDDMTWERQGRRREEDPSESMLLDAAQLSRVSRSAEIVFTLLSLALGEELMGSAVRGIFQGDAHVRGTALEYLETTLPETLRRALWPRIPGAEPTRPSRGSRELAAELLRSSADLRRTR